MTTTMDKKINELFEVVRKQKAEVEAAEKESKQKWVTNCSIQLEGVQSPVNLQSASEATVKKIVMSLLKHREYAEKAEAILLLEASDKYDTYTYDDWFADCKKRIASINIIEKKKQLAQLEARLNGIVSPEQKRQMELDAITASLGVN